MAEKYVAYVASNTNMNVNCGLGIYDVDIKVGTMKKREEVTANNASYLKISKDKKYLYVLVDEGISSYKILADGSLEYMNTASIRGMRGCYIDISPDNKYIFVAGMYDGKATVLRLNEDGSVGEITENYFNKGMGSVAETSATPHITCVKPAPDGKYVCIVDAGMNQIKIMQFDEYSGRMHMQEMVHCEQNSGPRMVLFDKTGRFMYVIFGKLSFIKVYSYDGSGAVPVFEELQKESTARIKNSTNNTALAMRFSPDEKYLLCSNGGDNTVGVFERDVDTGLLKRLCVLPISGAYPMDMGMIEDSNYMFSVNNEENTVTFFELNLHNKIEDRNGREVEKNYFAMCSIPVKVPQPNCMRVIKIEE